MPQWQSNKNPVIFIWKYTRTLIALAEPRLIPTYQFATFSYSWLRGLYLDVIILY